MNKERLRIMYEASNDILRGNIVLSELNKNGLENRKYLYDAQYNVRIIYNGKMYNGILSAAVLGEIIGVNAFKIYQYMRRKGYWTYSNVDNNISIEAGEHIRLDNTNISELFK